MSEEFEQILTVTAEQITADTPEAKWKGKGVADQHPQFDFYLLAQIGDWIVTSVLGDTCIITNARFQKMYRPIRR